MEKYFEDLDTMINPIKKEISSAIEIGCGEGHVTKHINDMGINIEGADLYGKIVDTARILHPSIKFNVISLYELSNHNKSYDLVLATEVLEHLDDPERAIKEMIKSSQKYIFLSVPNDILFRLANIFRLRYLCDLGNTPGHVNHWSEVSFREFLERQRLSKIQLKCSTLWLMAICEVRADIYDH